MTRAELVKALRTRGRAYVSVTWEGTAGRYVKAVKSDLIAELTYVYDPDEEVLDATVRTQHDGSKNVYV